MKATIFDGHTTRAFTAADHDIVSADTPFGWIDVCADGPDDPQVAPFLASLGFSDILAAYTSRSDGLGLFQQFDNNLVGATWAMPDEGNEPVIVHLVWNPARLVTVRAGANKAMASVTQQIDARGLHLFSEPTVVPGVVMELILASVDSRLTNIDGEVADLDGEIIVAVSPAQLPRLRAIRDQVAPLARRLPTYLDNVAEAFVDPTSLPGMDSNGAQYLQAYQGKVQSTVSRIGDVESSIRDAAQDYQTEVGNKQGQRINQLTIVSILFLPITFLTGYFGMNFQWLVNETESFSSWLLLGAVAPVVVVLASAGVLARRGFDLRRSATSRRATELSHPPTPT